MRTFGGCRKVTADYRTIGVALLRFEHSCASVLVATGESAALRELKSDVVCIPTETLVSYLDDITDPQLSIEELYLARGRLNLLSPLGISTLSLGIAAILCFVMITTDFPLALAAATSPFMLVAALFAISRHHSIRRLRFAKVLQAVIAERRGPGIRRKAIASPATFVGRHSAAA